MFSEVGEDVHVVEVAVDGVEVLNTGGKYLNKWAYHNICIHLTSAKFTAFLKHLQYLHKQRNVAWKSERF